MFYLGIDQHAKQLTLSLRNHEGDVVLSRQVSTEPKRFDEFFSKLRDRVAEQKFLAVIEVCGFNEWLIEALLGAIPGRQFDDLQPGQCFDGWERFGRQLPLQVVPAKNRFDLVGGTSSLSSDLLADHGNALALRVDLRRNDYATDSTDRVTHGYPIPVDPQQFAERVCVASVGLDLGALLGLDQDDVTAAVLGMDHHLEEFTRLTDRMKSLEETITSRGRGIEEVELLRTIPGCGYYMAVALACRIGEPSEPMKTSASYLH